MTFDGYDWLPTLNDIEYWKSQGTTEEQTYYSQFGFERLVVPTSCTHVSAQMTDLKTLFVQRYGFRRLNAETMPRWQIRLQNTFDAIVQDMERAFTLYESNDTAMKSDIIRGTTTTNSGTDTVIGSSTDKNVDTPDAAVNASDEYADSLHKNNSSTSTAHGHIVTTQIKGELVERVNNFIDHYKDIDQEFIKKFENNFLNVFDY